MDRRQIIATSAGALSGSLVVAVIVGLAFAVRAEASKATPEAAVRVTCHASRVFLENVSNGHLRYAAWQRKGQPPKGPVWEALVRVDSAGAHVLDCKHGNFTHFPLPF